ncbi:TRAP transporter substrate-binding protein [Paracidovorax wautersii]|uniref:Tripartite ATP-independent transporter solute receptor, DctP family n=1 Tax=Paracidovorax wautersii TaxID=1177982 RepID=A0A1I2FDU5_9BURK|nr:TRAP transporter substrate-binding protein [Paracidovorax wautersii]SFF02706.1 tripartite ATP-independent transporter solute receptor, DctP family [Paracidovorax wautersii]
MQPFWKIALAAAAIAASALSGAQEIKARFGTSLPDSHPQTLGARKFAERVEAKTAGRIKVAVYSAGQLGSDLQMQAALQGGTQEFAAPSTATLAGLVKDFGVLGLPFSFADEKEADAVLDGPLGRKLLAQLPARGLVGLAFWENGFRNVTNNKRPIVRAEDIAGLKVRTMQNSLYIDMFSGLGANAVPMSVTELFTALESHAVDAQENPYTVVHAQKFYDVQKYLSTTGHAYDALALIVSKKFWDRLSAADRQAVQAAAAEATVYERTTSRALNAQLRAELAHLGMQINDVSPQERARMREKLQPVIAKYTAGAGEETAREFFAAIEQARKP